MKKVLILIVIILLGVLCWNIVTSGYKIAGIKIMSIYELQAQNENLDATIATIENTKEVEYPAKISEMNAAAKILLSNKKTYEELAAYSSEQEVLKATHTERYDIEVLWVRIGNHATATGVIPKLEILASANNTTGANDLRITATGNYIAITDFVREIEDDSKLGFPIENFELVPIGSGAELQATFKVQDIFINPNTSTTKQPTNDNNANKDNENKDNANKDNTNKDNNTNTINTENNNSN